MMAITNDNNDFGFTTSLLVLLACLCSVATSTETEQAGATTTTTTPNSLRTPNPAVKETDWSARTRRLFGGGGDGDGDGGGGWFDWPWRDPVPWIPGEFGTTLTDRNMNRVEVNRGLNGRVLAYADEDVILDDGTNVGMQFHRYADGGQVFAKEDGTGYYYLSNDEDGSYPDGYKPGLDRSTYSEYLTGGVYRLEFTNEHQFIGYKKLLSLTADNCGAGRTPWGTYLSCEEFLTYGQCWQVDPEGVIEPQATAVTDNKGYAAYGNWEAFTFYDGHGYTTDDDYPYGPGPQSWNGALTRYTPDKAGMECLGRETKAERWCALNSGKYEFLRLEPSKTSEGEGTFRWVSEITLANAELYEGGEGIDAKDGVLVFTAKYLQHIFFLNLNDMTYVRSDTPFQNEQPDNIRIMENAVWMCQDGGEQAGIWVRDFDGRGTNSARILYGLDYLVETSGIDFSPDRTRMIMSFQGAATWMFWREDGLPFDDLPETYEAEYRLRDWFHDHNYDMTTNESKEDMVALRGGGTVTNITIDAEGE